MSADMSPPAIDARLRRASALADLRSEHRLHAKIDMSPAAIVRRLREVERLRRLCLELGRLRPGAR
jgi:hypothetical protein